MKLKQTLSLLLALAIVIIAAPFSTNAVQFGDTANHWTNKFIDWSNEAGLIQGYPDGAYRPERFITKAEFVKIINRLLGAEEKAAIHFTDVTSDQWYYEELQKAVKVSYIKNGGAFRGNDYITRNEAFRILAFAYHMMASGEQLQIFSDYHQIANKGEIAALLKAGIVNGYLDNTMKLNDPIKRGEAAKLFYTAEVEANVVKIKLHKPIIVVNHNYRYSATETETPAEHKNEMQNPPNEPQNPHKPNKPVVQLQKIAITKAPAKVDY